MSGPCQTGQEGQNECIYPADGGESVCCPPLFPGPGRPDNTFGHNPECWVGMSNGDFSGELSTIRGDETGCLPCDDNTSAMFAYSDDLEEGSRWLKPDAASPFNRDASGKLHDLLSRQPHLIVGRVDYVRGTGWDWEGKECFGRNVCNFTGINRPPTEAVLGFCGGTPIGQIMPGNFPDEFFWNGSRWPYLKAGEAFSYRGSMYVRKFTDNLPSLGDYPDHGVHAEPSMSFGLPDPVFLRAAWRGGCNVNYMVPCMGKVRGGVCYGSLTKKIARGETTDEHWNSQASRSRFDELWIIANSARFAVASGAFPAADLRIIAIKNRVLDFVRDVAARGIGTDGKLGCAQGAPGCVRLDRLDRYNNSDDVAHVGMYVRGWRGTHLQTIQRPEIPNVFGVCRMRHAGCRVRCRLHVDGFEMHASLLAHMVKQRNPDLPGNPVNSYWEPHVRIGIRVKLAVSAEPFEGDPCFIDSFTLPVIRTPLIISNTDGTSVETREDFMARCTNDPAVQAGFPDPAARAVHCSDLWSADREGAGGVPVVTPAGADEIEFLDPDGEPITPPLSVEWLGYLGHASVPSAGDERRPCGGTVAEACHTVADFFSKGPSGLSIPGWPSMVDSAHLPEDELYAGDIKIGFRPR